MLATLLGRHPGDEMGTMVLGRQFQRYFLTAHNVVWLLKLQFFQNNRIATETLGFDRSCQTGRDWFAHHSSSIDHCEQFRVNRDVGRVYNAAWRPTV